jgi:hypothetical protein
MQYAKLDAALAARMGGSAGTLPVFVRFSDASSSEARTLLKELGITAGGGELVFAIAASPQLIARLSDQNCIRSIQLSGSSRAY